MHLITPCRRTAPLALALLLCAGALHAQQSVPVPAAAPGSTMPAAAADTVELLPPARAADTVRTDRDRLLRELREAENQWAALRDQSLGMRANLVELKTAIESAADREKLAKKAKRDDERVAAQTDKRRLERARDLIEARIDLREAQTEAMRIQRDYLDAGVRAADAELVIAERRDQVLPDDASQRTAFEELNSRWLLALRTHSARAYNLEARRFKVIEAQIDMLKRQRQ